MKDFPYKHLSVLVMPTDYCNMDCVYCFNSRKQHKKDRTMSLETLQRLFQITIPFYEEISFIWHGGEPTSMGLDFFKKAVEMQEKANVNQAKINNSIQSNLSLLNEEMVEFFLENKFRIGGSFDGTKNELTRHNTEKILNGRQLVISKGGRVGFICVVQSKNVDCLIEDYEWFKRNKINYTINPYLTSVTDGTDDLFVPSKHYIQRVCEFFDYWSYDSGCNIKISYFEDFVKYILYKEKDLCCYNSCLGKHIGVHYNGAIYNCNRDFPKSFSFGNIYDYTDIRQCFNSQGFEKLLEKAVERRYNCKSSCEIYGFCEGGCNSTALASGDIAKANSYSCEVLISVYKFIENRLKDLVKLQPEDLEKINPYLAEKIKRSSL